MAKSNQIVEENQNLASREPGGACQMVRATTSRALPPASESIIGEEVDFKTLAIAPTPTTSS
jgi:hypothetical protein